MQPPGMRGPVGPMLPPPPPTGKRQVVQVFFYPQGFYYASDAQKRPVEEESDYWFKAPLLDMIARGVINDDTIIHVPTLYAGPLGQLRAIYKF